ncbi:MAG: hypothetical protein ACXWWC_07640 [Chitinophagaceae bacterium]
MINNKRAEAIPGYIMMNLSPASLLQENNKSVNEKKYFSSSLFGKQVEKNCQHRTETGFCMLSNKPCLHFSLSNQI